MTIPMRLYTILDPASLWPLLLAFGRRVHFRFQLTLDLRLRLAIE